MMRGGEQIQQLGSLGGGPASSEKWFEIIRKYFILGNRYVSLENILNLRKEVLNLKFFLECSVMFQFTLNVSISKRACGCLKTKNLNKKQKWDVNKIFNIQAFSLP